jgi:flagellar biosynthesis/type III secretory pathway M-ring protein FliF/YscJ
MLRRLLPPPARALAAGAASVPALPAGQPPALAPPGAASGDDDGVTLDPEARQRGELIKRARSVIEQSPDEAAAIVRSWLHES